MAFRDVVSKITLKKVIDTPIINPQKWYIFIWRRLQFKEVLKVVNKIAK